MGCVIKDVFHIFKILRKDVWSDIETASDKCGLFNMSAFNRCLEELSRCMFMMRPSNGNIFRVTGPCAGDMATYTPFGYQIGCLSFIYHTKQCYFIATWIPGYIAPLQWRHYEHGGVPNHQHHDCLLNRYSRRRSKKTSKLRVTGLCAGNSSVTGEFPAQMASNAENVSIWWCHHVDESCNSNVASISPMD